MNNKLLFEVLISFNIIPPFKSYVSKSSTFAADRKISVKKDIKYFIVEIEFFFISYIYALVNVTKKFAGHRADPPSRTLCWRK